jgi:hypothetical protein
VHIGYFEAETFEAGGQGFGGPYLERGEPGVDPAGEPVGEVAGVGDGCPVLTGVEEDDALAVRDHVGIT